NGPEWYAGVGPEKNGGPKLYCVSGHVKHPGGYEASKNITLRELVEGRAGGARDGRTLKAVVPGGSSVPRLMPDQLDMLASIDGNIAGKPLCAFGDAAVTPITTTLKHFRHEYEAHIREGKCTLPASWRARHPEHAGAH